MTSRRPRRAIGSPETIAEVDDTSVPSATAAQPAQSGDDAEEPHVAANIAKRRAARAAQRRAEEAKLEAEVESLRARSATPAEPASADSDVEPSASAPPLARWSTSPRSSMGMTDAPQKQLKRADSASKLLESAVSQSFRKSKKRSTETIDCFVQRWTKEKVQQAYERIFELLYPGFQPTEADEDTLHTALYDLRDEWQKHIADRSVPLLAHEIAGTAAAGVQYVLDEPTESNRPLVITVAQLQQVLNFTFEREDTGESAKSTEDEELSIPAELHANEHRIRLQRILRPFLDRYFNLHQATLPQTPLRNTLREVTSLLLVCCYGHETHLLAACLNAFKLMPSNTLSTGTLQRLATEVCSIAFEFTSHLEDDTKLCVVEFFGGVLRNHVAAMTPGGQITILELTMTLSQDSHIKELLSKHLLPYTFKQLPPAAVSWCLCGRGGPQGDEGSQGGTGSAPSSAAPSAPPSAPPSTGPTLRHLRADSLTSSEPPRHLRNSSSTSSLGAGSGSMSASAAANIVPVLCILCQQAEADEATSTSKEFAKATFQRMIDSVVQAKSTEPVLLDFLRAPQSGALLPPALLQVSPSFCSVLTSIGSGRSSRFGLVGQQMLVNLLLLGCKWIRTRSGSEPPQQGEPAAAMVRRLHGMKLLLALLKRSKGFLAVSKTLQMLLRAVIVPTLVHAATVALSPSTTSSGGNPADTGTLLSLVLSTHIYLTDHLQAYISSELAHMNTHLWIPAISGTWTTLHQKQLVLELQRHVFRGPRQVMTTYYNHRYLTREWKPVEDLVAALIQLLEGEVESCPEVTSASLGAPSSDAGDAVSTVRLLSFQLLVHLLAAQAQWIGVPGVKRPANSESGQQQLPRPMTDQGASKKSEWQATIQQQQRDQQLEDQALQLSRGGKIKAALRYLQQMRPCAGSISEMARYLYETEGLNPADVGDFLANLDDDFLTAAQYGQLRLAYTRLIDFTGLSFPESLRRFLCDSGFRLPGEAQKIDRMLEAFCSVFVALNPTSFRDSSSAFIVCFALVMLNTDLHDPRLKGGGKSGGSSASSRTPMTLKQFISNLRGVDAGGDFPSEFLTEMYDNIRLKGMEWKEEEQAGGAGGREGKQGSEKGLLSGLSKRGSISQADRLQLQLGQVDRTLMQIRRRLESHLRRARERQYGWSVPTRSWLVAPLFDSTWYRCLGTISLLSSHSTLSLHHGFDGGSSSSQASVTSTRFDALKICLDGLAYGATIAMVLGSKTEYDAYLSVLAQVIYVENARSEHRKKVMVEELKMRQKTTSVKVSAAATNEIASLSTSVPTADAATSAPSDSTPTASTSSAFNAEASWAKFDQQLGKKLAKRHHLKQDWFLRLSSSDLAPDTICRSILSLCTQTKQTVNQRIRQARLKQLQETMGEVALVCIGRDLLKEGVLGKFKNSSDAEHSASSSASASDPSASSSAAPGEKRQFQFVLCTDVFFYARPGKAKGSPLQLRSTYQLALMEKPRELRKLDDPQGGSFPFVFSTAQSLTPVQLSASSPQERKDWINILCQQIDVIRTRFATALSLSDVRVSKRLSKFIGSAEALGTDEDASSSSSSLSFPHDTFCRLCLKSYHPLFRRPTTCEWCGERVCGECATGKVRVPQMLHVHASVQKHSGLSSSSSSSDDPSTSELSPTNSSSAAPAAPAKTSFFSKASASVNSMGSKLRHAVSKLEAERDTAMNGGVRITVCAACHLPLTTECDEFDSMQRGTSTNK